MSGNILKRVRTREVASNAKDSVAFHSHNGTHVESTDFLNHSGWQEAMRQIQSYGVNSDIEFALSRLIMYESKTRFFDCDTVFFTMNGIPLFCILNLGLLDLPSGVRIRKLCKLLAFYKRESIHIDISDVLGQNSLLLLELLGGSDTNGTSFTDVSAKIVHVLACFIMLFFMFYLYNTFMLFAERISIPKVTL